MLVTVIVAGLLSVLFKLFNWELGLVIASLIAMYCGYFTANRQSATKRINNKKGKRMILLTIVLLACITFASRYLFLHPKLPIRMGLKPRIFFKF